MSSNAIIEICAFTIDAYNYARAAATLLDSFYEEYFEDTGHDNLKFDIESRPQIVESKIFTICHLAHDVFTELEKIQNTETSVARLDAARRDIMRLFADAETVPARAEEV